MLVDHHCHLDFPQLQEQFPDVLARARNADVGVMITISTRIREFDKLTAIVAAHPHIFCSVGTHPHYADQELDIPLEEIVKLSAHPKCVAIGEAGLDYHYDNAPRTAQEEGFRRHIAAARETGLPLVIHTRDADDDTARILEEEMAAGAFTAVLHCFTGGRELAERGLALGLYISFSGVLTFKTAETLQAIARTVPADRMLVETDAPYLAPIPFRGKPNEPAYVVHTATKLAELRAQPLDEIARQTSENAFRLYAKLPRNAGGSA